MGGWIVAGMKWLFNLFLKSHACKAHTARSPFNKTSRDIRNQLKIHFLIDCSTLMSLPLLKNSFKRLWRLFCYIGQKLKLTLAASPSDGVNHSRARERMEQSCWSHSNDGFQRSQKLRHCKSRCFCLWSYNIKLVNFCGCHIDLWGNLPSVHKEVI